MHACIARRLTLAHSSHVLTPSLRAHVDHSVPPYMHGLPVAPVRYGIHFTPANACVPPRLYTGVGMYACVIERTCTRAHGHMYMYITLRLRAIYSYDTHNTPMIHPPPCTHAHMRGHTHLQPQPLAQDHATQKIPGGPRRLPQCSALAQMIPRRHHAYEHECMQTHARVWCACIRPLAHGRRFGPNLDSVKRALARALHFKRRFR